MNVRIVFAVAALAALVLAPVARAEGKAQSTGAQQQFDMLKKLAGEWVAVQDGKPTDKVVSSIKVTANGSAIQETLFPGTAEEMVTMYHLDGSELLLTHYCALGNQPRMKAEPSKEKNKIVFKFAGGTNMKSDKDMHMDHATITVVDDNHVQAEWIGCQDGKDCHTAKFELVRKAK